MLKNVVKHFWLKKLLAIKRSLHVEIIEQFSSFQKYLFRDNEKRQKI